jgi:hypothetical protein
MRTVVTLLALSLVLFGSTACIQPIPVEDAKAAYCADLEQFNTAVQNVKNLPPDATVDQLDEAMKAVDDAYDELENSAWELADSQTAALQPAYNEMRAGFDSIDSGTSIEEARTVISDSITTYTDAYEEVVGTSCRDVNPA